jgi:hypothetical protein
MPDARRIKLLDRFLEPQMHVVQRKFCGPVGIGDDGGAGTRGIFAIAAVLIISLVIAPQSGLGSEFVDRLDRRRQQFAHTIWLIPIVAAMLATME